MTAYSYQVSRFAPGEEGVLWQLYHDTTHVVNGRAYTPAQCERWAPAGPDLDEWATRIKGSAPYVVRLDARVLGFGELESNGHIDFFYVHHEWQGRGAGTALYAAIEDEARRRGLDQLFLESSVTAKPFFERMGFVVTGETANIICGAPAPQFMMRKTLSNP